MSIFPGMLFRVIYPQLLLISTGYFVDYSRVHPVHNLIPSEQLILQPCGDNVLLLVVLQSIQVLLRATIHYQSQTPPAQPRLFSPYMPVHHITPLYTCYSNGSLFLVSGKASNTWLGLCFLFLAVLLAVKLILGYRLQTQCGVVIQHGINFLPEQAVDRQGW